jgi:hypothetical protein
VVAPGLVSDAEKLVLIEGVDEFLVGIGLGGGATDVPVKAVDGGDVEEQVVLVVEGKGLSGGERHGEWKLGEEKRSRGRGHYEATNADEAMINMSAKSRQQANPKDEGTSINKIDSRKEETARKSKQKRAD